MKRNPLLGLILSTCACLLIAAANTPKAMAQATTEGSLFVITNGQTAAPCPLKHTDVKAEISGFIARVTVTQEFANPFPDKIEAVYKFPLPQAAAVDDMTIMVGTRVVKGKIMTRDEAQKAYETARNRGQVAALLNQERPNIFTQSVANILPSQQIRVTISYVETLKYDEGSYEWSFPMVVGRRYIPANIPAEKPTTDTQQADTEETSGESVPNAAEITPPVMAKGMRAGHDVSLEVVLDAGVPIVAFRSETHDVEVVQPSPSRALVRLKDLATIPNKDFLLKYDVAGSQIEDALLMHREGNDGYFTFILQPPQRVTAADVNPKELVFVLDTSGSMEGFPIEKAKETMMLALDHVYPQDTFNLILFSGDTKILFSDPKPATPENINKAKKLIASATGNGGTEMMKAIRAALEPSDAQDHVRIVCFMTDGQVGDDLNIIAEVKKHPNARVFAMGFGSSPNRFLLDKISEYGRGEVEYVTEDGDAKTAAERFHERVRNPLLTDVSVDWRGLPVSDIYPKQIPDLFSAKPVIISGRYSGGGKAVIRLKGKMSGREFVREIPVEFPDQETQHNVLGTLWARRKVDDLMGQDMNGMQTGQVKDELKNEIINLGLNYRMMTQFTSFVAIEDQSAIDNVAPRRVDVPVEAPGSTNTVSSNGNYGGLTETVTVSAESSDVNSQSASLLSVIAQRSIQDLPVNGRSLQSLAVLAPGTVAPAPADPISNVRFNISVNGQRPASNQIQIDGVSGNFGIAPGGESPGASAAGSAPALTATGTTASLTPFGAIEEVTIRTYPFSAEFGRNSGGIISVVTNAGTNAFHGSGFAFFNNSALNANDWFANSRGLAKPPHGANEFGATLGGPIRRDRLFFFASYEGLRLRQPATSISDVPSLAARFVAAPNIRPLLNLYPLPNSAGRPDGFAEFAQTFTNRGRHDNGSFRFDDIITNRLSFRLHYNFADSSANERGFDRFSLNTLGLLFNRSHSLTGNASFTLSPKTALEIKVNYAHLNARSSYLLDNFGGAIAPPSEMVDTRSAVMVDLNGHNTVLMSGADVASTQRQLNVMGDIITIAGTHTFKFGADYRRMFPVIGLRAQEKQALFDGVGQASTGIAERLGYFSRMQPQTPVFNNFSVYAQDEWRKTSRLTLTYGLRWELNPAPRAKDRRKELLALGPGDLSQTTLGVKGSRLWQTTFANFAPRVGLAYQLNKAGTFVARGSLGVLYDATNGAAGDALADSYPFLTGTTERDAAFSFSPTAAKASSALPIVVPFSVFDPHLKLPYSVQWSVSVEREIGSRQKISAAYVASTNRRLLVTKPSLDPSADFTFVRATNNEGRSDYRALQIDFDRRFGKHLGALISYTWARSIDNFSEDSARRALFRASDLRLERGPSDFDVRHKLTGFVSYALPKPFDQGIGYTLLRNWSLDSLFEVRSADPVNVVYAVPTSFGFIFRRPDVIAGAPLYVTDPLVAGGQRINANAFMIPAGLRQGTLGRNALRGFAFSNFNVGLRRSFGLSENVRLIFGVEVLNVFNHPNFVSPSGNDASLGTRFDSNSALSVNQTFGQSFMNAARNSWGYAGSTLASGYYPGGPRTLRISLRLEF